MTSRKNVTQKLVLAALMAALTAICSQILIPLPLVPINLAALRRAPGRAHCSERKYGALIHHRLRVARGGRVRPSLAGFQSRACGALWQHGGYILGYVLCAFLVGLLSRRLGMRFGGLCLSMAVGVVVCYAFGTLWFMYVSGMNLVSSLSYCVLPFLPGDVVKILLAALLTLRLQKPLRALGFAR